MIKKIHYNFPDIREIKTEIIRKSLHFLIACVPPMAVINRDFTLILLVTGTLLFCAFEVLRFLGVRVPIISYLTEAAARAKYSGNLPGFAHFEFGPITLGIGAFFAVAFFPPEAAAIAVYAVAFGDGLASLIGKTFGRIRPVFLLGKSIEGFLACFLAVYLISFKTTGNFGTSLIAAVIASIVEVLPLGDYDNLALPLAVGLAILPLV